MEKYKYLLFDADNTLFDFNRCEREAFILAMDASGIEFSEDLYAEYHVINDGMWKQLEKGLIERSVLKTERFRVLLANAGIVDDRYVETARCYEGFLGRQTFEINGAYELLQKLHGKYKIFIITNGLTAIQEMRFSLSRLTALTDGVFISEKVGYAKPDKRYFDRVISAAGDEDVSKYLVIGDSLTSDIDGAIAYGIDCCWYNRSRSSPDGREVTYEIFDITELETVL